MGGVSPGSITNRMPPAEDDQARRARDLARTQRENAAARSLEATSIGEGGLRVIGGSIAIEAGGQLTVDGDATFNGSLTVPAGSLNTAGNVSAGGNLTAGAAVQGAAVISTGNASVAGDLTAGGVSTTGNLDVDGQMTIDGPIFTPHGRANSVVTSYVAAYINSDGRLGATPSRRDMKDHVEFYEVPETAWGLRPVVFTYKDDPQATPRLGFYAEDADAVDPLLAVHEDGEPFSLHDRALIAALWGMVRDLNERVQTLEGQSQ